MLSDLVAKETRNTTNITIVVVRFKEPISIVKDCIDSLLLQKDVRIKILILDQKHDVEFQNTIEDLNTSNMIEYVNIPEISVSFARNYGIKCSKTEIVCFIDADALADSNWVNNLSKTFENNKDVAVVGGKILPLWEGQVKWYHKASMIQEFYSILHISDKVVETDKIMGGNSAIKKEAIRKIGGFREELGRRDGKLLGGEETELCERAIKMGYKVLYNPNAMVLHRISKNRLKIIWVVKRIFYGGFSRETKGGIPKPYQKKKNFFDVMIFPLFITVYMAGFIFGYFRRRIML